MVCGGVLGWGGAGGNTLDRDGVAAARASAPPPPPRIVTGVVGEDKADVGDDLGEAGFELNFFALDLRPGPPLHRAAAYAVGVI